MATEVRYSEAEIAAIFELAAQAQQRAEDSHGSGLTLDELSQVGAAAGIDPKFVAAAASSVRASGPAPRRITTLGQQVNVGKAVVLPGPFSDDDWDALVSDLRITFHATGKVRASGSVREWRNGNLHVSVERSGGEHVLRMRSLNAQLQSHLRVGAIALLAPLFNLIFTAQAESIAGLLFFWTVAAVTGLALAISAAIRLPRWRSIREEQMADIASRAADRVFQRENSRDLNRIEPVRTQIEIDDSPDDVERREPTRSAVRS